MLTILDLVLLCDTRIHHVNMNDSLSLHLRRFGPFVFTYLPFPSCQSAPTLRTKEAADTIIGVCRDLQGVVAGAAEAEVPPSPVLSVACCLPIPIFSCFSMGFYPLASELCMSEGIQCSVPLPKARGFECTERVTYLTAHVMPCPCDTCGKVIHNLQSHPPRIVPHTHGFALAYSTLMFVCTAYG